MNADNGVLDMTPKAQATKLKKKWDYMKAKEMIHKM